jgi:hypothetical protein
MTMTDTVRTPQPGDPFRLDGFLYQLGGIQKRLAEGDRIAVVREFNRPAPASLDEREAHRANFAYKKGGLCNEADLEWVEPAEYLAQLRLQAATLKRGQPAAGVWADASCEVLEEAYAEAGGCWVLADRHLLQPPVARQVSGQFVPFQPRDLDTAEAIARAMLAHTFDHAEG